MEHLRLNLHEYNYISANHNLDYRNEISKFAPHSVLSSNLDQLPHDFCRKIFKLFSFNPQIINGLKETLALSKESTCCFYLSFKFNTYLATIIFKRFSIDNNIRQQRLKCLQYTQTRGHNPKLNQSMRNGMNAFGTSLAWDIIVFYSEVFYNLYNKPWLS